MKNLKELGEFIQEILIILTVIVCPVLFAFSLFGYQIAIYKPITNTVNQCVSR